MHRKYTVKVEIEIGVDTTLSRRVSEISRSHPKVGRKRKGKIIL